MQEVLKVPGCWLPVLEVQRWFVSPALSQSYMLQSHPQHLCLLLVMRRVKNLETVGLDLVGSLKYLVKWFEGKSSQQWVASF